MEILTNAIKVTIDVNRKHVLAYSPNQDLDGVWYPAKYTILKIIPKAKSGLPFDEIRTAYPDQNFVEGELSTAYDNLGNVKICLSVGYLNFICYS